MTNFQKVFCVILSLCFFVVLAFLPESSFLRGEIFRQVPLYRFLEDESLAVSARADYEMDELIVENNAAYLGRQTLKENQENAADVNSDGATEKASQEADPDEEQDVLDVTPETVPTIRPVPTPTAVQEPTAAPTAVPTAAPTPVSAATEPAEETAPALALPRANPVVDLSPELLTDSDYLLEQFYIVDPATSAEAREFDGEAFLEQDFSLEGDASQPQIVIYHTHSQETFADSREGERADTIVGVGDYLAELLTDTYGYNVLHVTEPFDVIDGELDRSRAYDTARAYMEPFLEEHPSVEVVIDLHRDGVPEDRRLVTEIDGKSTAQIMFYNGLSYTDDQGNLSYLPNPYLNDNLAFSFQLEYQAALYYPDLYRGIYLAGYRYNLHLRPRSILLEAGAQTNTVQEVKNAMEPFAQILDIVLKGGRKMG